MNTIRKGKTRDKTPKGVPRGSATENGGKMAEV